jgi:hypothetical protein
VLKANHEALNVLLVLKTLRVTGESALMRKDALEARNSGKLRSFDLVRDFTLWYANPKHPRRKRPN